MFSRVFLAGLLLSLAGVVFAQDDRLVLIDDSGFGSPGNVGVARMVEIDGRLFLGTWNAVEGAEIHRSRDGEAWQRVAAGGIGDNPSNFAVVSLAGFGGRLYAGTWNQQDGAALYRCATGVDEAPLSWEPVTEDGFGNPRNRGFTHARAFREHLYVGTFNLAEGSEVWRSRTGDPGSWSRVNPKSWGSAANSDSTTMLVHDGYLYVGTETARAIDEVGAQLWRTDGELSPPFDQWQQVNADGFDNPHNHNICGLAVLDDWLYAGTWNRSQGLEVWRADPSGDPPFDWKRVVDKGLIDPGQAYTATLTTMGGALFLGSIGDFAATDLLGPEARLHSAVGGMLATSVDGLTWESIDRPGFLDPPFVGVQWLTAFRGRLFIGVQAVDRPFQLWAYTPVEP